MFRLKVFTTSVVVLLLLTSVSQSVISRSRPALTPPPAHSPAPPLPVSHKYRVASTRSAPGATQLSDVASEVNPRLPARYC